MSPRDPKPPLRVVGPRDADAPTTALERPAPGGRYAGLVMACAPAEAARRLQELQAFVRSVMVEGEDFMTLPGASKPTLLKPGAQKLAEIYGFAHRFVVAEEIKDWAAGFFYFSVRCLLTSRADGSFVGEGMGSCNSREAKHAQRWVQRKHLPPGVDATKLECKEVPSKFENGSPYLLFLTVNEDPYTLVNTLMKQAAKRAYVDGVTAVTRSSGLFTQDREDLPADVFGVVEEERTWQREVAPPPPIAFPAPAPSPPSEKRSAPAKGDTGEMSPREMSPRERETVAMFGPMFPQCKSRDDVRRLARQAAAAVGGMKASRPYQEWHKVTAKHAYDAIGGDR